MFKSFDIFNDSANTIIVYSHGLETNNQAACMALVKWLKHSSKHSNEMVNKERLAWQVMADRSYKHQAPIDTQNVEQCPKWTNEHFCEQ